MKKMQAVSKVCQRNSQLNEAYCGTMEQISTAIQTVSSTIEDTVANSEGILKSVNEVVYSINEIFKASQARQS